MYHLPRQFTMYIPFIIAVLLHDIASCTNSRPQKSCSPWFWGGAVNCDKRWDHKFGASTLYLISRVIGTPNSLRHFSPTQRCHKLAYWKPWPTESSLVYQTKRWWSTAPAPTAPPKGWVRLAPSHPNWAWLMSQWSRSGNSFGETKSGSKCR